MNKSRKQSRSASIKINLKINRKNILFSLVLVLIALLILSSILLVYSYKIPVNKSIVRTIKYADLYIVSDVKFVVKPALIYDYQTIIDGMKTYFNLVKETMIRITLNSKIYPLINNGDPKETKISFSNSAYIETSEWSKEVVINTSVINNDPKQYTIEIRLNMTNISELVNKINSEINKMINEYKLIITPTILITVKYENGHVKKYVIDPIISVTINRNTNIISVNIDNTQKNYIEKKSNNIKNYLNPIGMSVSEARFYSLISVSILAPLAVGLTFYYLHKYELREKEKNIHEKYKKYIIKGEIKALGDKPIINIKNFDVLIKLAKTYKKPLIYDEKNRSFYIVMTDTAYMYDSKNMK